MNVESQKGGDLLAINGRSYAKARPLLLESPLTSFFVSVGTECKNGRESNHLCRAHVVQIVVSPVTLSSGVLFLAIFTRRKRMSNVFVDQAEHGMWKVLNFHQKRNEDSDIFLVFFACHLVSRPQKRCLQHKAILFNQFISPLTKSHSKNNCTSCSQTPHKKRSLLIPFSDCHCNIGTLDA